MPVVYDLNERLDGAKLRWPDDPTPRAIRIDVFDYIGLAMGAKHFVATVELEDNCIVTRDGSRLFLTRNLPPHLQHERAPKSRAMFRRFEDACVWALAEAERYQKLWPNSVLDFAYDKGDEIRSYAIGTVEKLPMLYLIELREFEWWLKEDLLDLGDDEEDIAKMPIWSPDRVEFP